MKKSKRYGYFICVLFLNGMGLPENAVAADLWLVYQHALVADQDYQKADAVRRSLQEALPQNIANILPNLTGTYSNVATRLRIDSPSLANSYGTQSYSLNVNQPLINFSQWMNIGAAGYTYRQAAATYAAALQDLILRTSTAYFNVLLAEDTLRISLAQKKWLARQLNDAKQRYKAGVVPKTTLYSARASYDGSVAEVIDDQNNVQNQYENLRILTNQYYSSLAKLKHTIPLIEPQPAIAANWVYAAEQSNLTLRAARYAADAARLHVKAQAGGHFPTVNATASLSKTQGLFVFPNQLIGTANQETVGVNVTIPIYQGGLVSSEVRQAQDDYQAISVERERIGRQITAQTEQSYHNVIAGISKLNADKQSMRSHELAFKSTQAGYQAGTQTLLDVLDAQRQWFDAQRKYAADQYSYLLNTLTLKQLAGTLCAQDLQTINQWLTEK